MFQGFTDETFEFFMAIRFNNNADFFHDNHDWYMRAVRRPCMELAGALSDVIESIDDSLDCRPNRVVSRINRDIRFSNDKSPYRDHIWLGYHRMIDAPRDRRHIDPTLFTPGFYFEIRAEGGFCGMGMYNENRPLMNGLRRRMVNEPEAFLERWLPVRDDFPAWLRSFKRMRLPDGLSPELAEWYPVRSFYVEKSIPDFSLLKSPGLVDALAADYRKLSPLYWYICETPPVPDEDKTKIDGNRVANADFH